MKNNVCEKAKELLKKSKILTSDVEELFSIDFPSDDLTGFQGGCSDGSKYYYVILMHYDLASKQENNYSVIAKFDINTGEVVKLSERVSLHHANDMTYNPKDNTVIVCHNRPRAKWLSIFDADTLEFIRKVEIAVDAYSIDYNEKRNCYLLGISGSYNFVFLDENFELLNDKVYSWDESTTRYVKQGACVDDEMLYFILWDGRHTHLDDFQNGISVYNWDGEFLGVIEFNIGIREPENLSIIDGKIYAVCGDAVDRPALYRFTPKLK